MTPCAPPLRPLSSKNVFCLLLIHLMFDLHFAKCAEFDIHAEGRSGLEFKSELESWDHFCTYCKVK